MKKRSTPFFARGSVYVAVLGIALLVMVVGVSALLAMRVGHRAASLTEAAAKARFGAASVIELALYWLNADQNWRTTYANDTWTAQQTAGGVTFSFKLVDEQDGNLANDPTQTARLYAKAVVGDVTRIESVRLTPSSVSNLLSNPDMENGTTGWFASTGCEIESRTDGPHGGAKCINTKNRTFNFSGPSQTITSVVKNGTAFQFEAWVRMASGTDSVGPIIETNASGSGTRWAYGGATLVGTTWTKVSATMTPSWSGTLSFSHFHMATSSTTNEYRIDDAALIEQVSGPLLVLIPGTWRQDVLP